VDNLAAIQVGLVSNPKQCQKEIGSFACGPVRSGASRSRRAQERLPAGSEASVPKSERTISQEDPVSGRLRAEAKADAARHGSQTLKRKCAMSSRKPLVDYFAGLDWAKRHHHVVIVDAGGQIVSEFSFSHTLEGWQQWHQQVARFGPLAVAIETNQGAVIDQLLQTSDCTIYPINPKAARAYRNRKAPSGTKSDHLDAWSFADALRLDGSRWKPLSKRDPLWEQLHLLCRDEIALIEERTALVNQLIAALHEYYPTALAAFEDWTLPAAWAFVEAFATPQALVNAGKRRWEKFLHTHKLARPDTYQKRLELFARSKEFGASDALTLAKSRLALTRARQLRVLQTQLEGYRQQIEMLFAQHPDHELFGSLPGAGPKIAPRLLGELGQDRQRFESSQALQCYAGTAPVSYQSGPVHRVRLRTQCNLVLRFTIHLWADRSRHTCPWAEAYYQNLRKRGKSHACALRCLGQRWLKILWKMWQTHTCYDAELHRKNQLRHGSWVLASHSA
jgi:transposase